VDFVSLPCTITAYYKSWNKRAERTWESVLTRSIVRVVGNEYFRIVVIVTGTLLTSYVLQAIPQVMLLAEVKFRLALHALDPSKSLGSYGAPLSPRMSDARVDAIVSNFLW
jgi:hypothetical protein